MTQGGAGQAGTGQQGPVLAQAARQVSLLWWVPLLTGLVSVLVGLLILVTDWAVKGLVVVVGLLFLIHGVALVFSPVYARQSRGEQVMAGLVEVLAGVVLLAWPAPTFLVLAEFAGIWLVLAGGFHLVTSVARRHALPAWGLSAAVGAIEVLLGLWVMRRPDVTLGLVVVVLGLWAVIVGVLECVLAFEVRGTVRTLAGASAATPDEVAALRTRVDRLYAEGQLSEEQHATLVGALEPGGSPSAPPAPPPPDPRGAPRTPQPQP
ncbi:MAG: HdeD family acid-resistance protein [Oryzihumus sp.]